MRIQGYTYQADYHCITCTLAARDSGAIACTGLGYYAKEEGEDENGLAYALADREGNSIGPIFSTDEGPLDESGRCLGMWCGDCGAEIRAGDPAETEREG